MESVFSRYRNLIVLVGVLFLQVLGLAMQVFIDHPGQWRLLGQDPGLAPAAVEEVMRVSPTTTWVTREAIADFTFDGLAISAGTTIHLLCEPVGTDPRAGGQVPVDIAAPGRPPHLAFGGGIHYCLGAPLARLEGEIAITTLLTRLPDLRLAIAPEDVIWRPAIELRGLQSLPVAF